MGKTKLTGDDNSISYKYARSKLIEAFHELQEEIDFPLEFRKIVSKHKIYIEYDNNTEDEESSSVKKESTNTKDTSDPEQDLSGFEGMLTSSDEELESVTLSGSETSSEHDH